MSILVTGGAGFIGSHVVERLVSETAEKVVVLDNFNSDYDPRLKQQNVARWAEDARIVVVTGDVGDAARIGPLLLEHDVRRIVHLAGSPGVRESVNDPRRYFENNVLATLTLLEAMRTLPIERMLYASSSTVYGRGAPIPFAEDGPLGVPLSPYGASKRAAEILALTYHGLHHSPVCVLRLFNVYGPRLRPELALSIFTSAVLKGESLPLFGDGSVRRDFAHVSDVSRGIVAALFAEGVDGETINLGQDRPVTVARVIELIAEAAGVPAVIDRRAARPEEMPVTCADIAKARRLLNYEPRMSIEEGVADFVRWYRATHGL